MPPPAPSGVSLQIISNHYVDLERRDHAGAEWRLVCHMDSCDRVPSDGEYRITADGMPPSDPFRLAAHGDKATLKVRPGSESKRTAGFIVLGAGGVLTLGGIVAFAAGVAPSSTFQNDNVTHTRNTDAISLGSGLILVGVAAGLTGASWAYNGSRTLVGGDVTPLPKSPERDASRNKPIARHSYHFHESAQPSFWEIPVLGGTF